ncbi:MAG: TrkH family potassium uptake protein [Alphaproteobacteria bacterium]|nr:TrkH family potassium uptake protein [Alphaproteobacteria bacterium]
MLTILAATMAIPAMADIIVGNPDWRIFIAAASVTAFVGIALTLAARTEIASFSLRQAFLLTSLSWVVVAAFGALPFAFSRLNLSYADAYFETMSGLTTTGSTVIVGLDKAPAGVLLWRGLLSLIGGVGIIALAIAVLPLLRVGGMQLFRLESSDKSEKVLPRAGQIVIGIGTAYLLLNFACALSYWIAGMDGFDAVNHAMSTIATGGFTTSDSSFGKYDSPLLDGLATVFMLMGGMTFTLFLRMYQGEHLALWRDKQTHAYLGTFAAFAAAIATWLVLAEGKEIGFAVRHAAFTVSSVITTTGFASTDWGVWGPFPLVLIFMLTFVGGCSGSTSGGIKIFRFQVLFQIGRTQIRQALQPSGVFISKYDRKPISDAVAQSVLAFVTLYVFTWAMASAALGLCGLDLITALTGAATALGNVGPGLGEIIGPAGTFAPLPTSAKWILSFAMLLGRLELITVFVLLSRRFWRS